MSDYNFGRRSKVSICVLMFFYLVFVFKQKTAYEMRISVCSSDVCSSDLIGAVKAEEPPIVIITSNRTREIHDALKRRFLYYWVDYPDAERELAIQIGRATSELQSLMRISSAVLCLKKKKQ